jgi:Uma2 family endonuclease
LIDPTKRQVEVFTLTEAGAWLLTDQTTAVELTLTSIDCRLPMHLAFKGVASSRT